MDVLRLSRDMHRRFALLIFTVQYLCADQSIGNTDSGDQAVLQCSGHGGDWCCDHNRDASNVCCDSLNSNEFFPLSKGTSVASISTTGPAAASANIVGNPGNGGMRSSGTTSTSSSTSTTPSSTSTSTSSATSITKSAVGGTANQSPASLVSVISIISIVTTNGGLITATSMIVQTISPTTVPASWTPSHLGAEIGGGIGGGIALIALILFAFFLLHRRKKRRQYQSAPTAENRNSLDYMYKSNDMGSPHTAETSPEIDGTPIVGAYRGWGATGGERALRVMNGSDRQSMNSAQMGTKGRDSVMSELESPTTPVRAGLRSQQPTIAEQPYELAGEREGEK
ncbi:MAG: hypothetical protein Q9175_001657 [Cornicularia normoerica]